MAAQIDGITTMMRRNQLSPHEYIQVCMYSGKRSIERRRKRSNPKPEKHRRNRVNNFINLLSLFSELTQYRSAHISDSRKVMFTQFVSLPEGTIKPK